MVSSPWGDPSSMLLFRRVKGEFQRDVKEKSLKMLSIFNPGAIKNRPDARTAEKIAQFFSFLPFDQVECKDLGICIKNVAEDFHE